MPRRLRETCPGLWDRVGRMATKRQVLFDEFFTHHYKMLSHFLPGPPLSPRTPQAPQAPPPPQGPEDLPPLFPGPECPGARLPRFSKGL